MRNDEPLISLVLPTYNGARFLAESIKSCIDQTYSNWELIIVDDASTDNTPELIADFCARDNRIRSIRHEDNKKLPGALNTGFNSARGEYLSWTSDDNLYEPAALEKMIGFLIDHPEVDFVYADYNIIDETGDVIEWIEVDPPEIIGFRDAVGACFLYRREVQETLGGYDETLFLAEDLDFWLRAQINFNLKPLHQTLYSYRDHGKSLTRSRGKQIYQAHFRVINRYWEQMTWMSKELKSHTCIRLTRQALKHGEYTKAIGHLITAVRISPLFVIRRFLFKVFGIGKQEETD